MSSLTLAGLFFLGCTGLFVWVALTVRLGDWIMDRFGLSTGLVTGIVTFWLIVPPATVAIAVFG